MAPTGPLPSAISRTSPTKLAIPPMRRLPVPSAASSPPTSNASRWTRIIARSAAGDRREQRYLVPRSDRMIEADIILVDGNADHREIGEGAGKTGAAGAQPIEQGGNRADTWRQVDPFLGDADPGPQPSEIQQRHGITS